MALLDELGALLGENGASLDALSGYLEADTDSTQRLLDCSLPALLGGLALRTQSDSGADAVFSMVRNHDGVLLDDVAGFVDAGDAQSIGSSLVGSVLGRRRNLVEQQLAATSGIGVGSVAKFLPTLAPLVMSFLGRKAAGGGLNAGGLASMLDGNLASMQVAGHHDVLEVLGDVPTDVASADAGFLSGLSRIAGLGGLGALVGAGTSVAAEALPTLETVAAPTQFREAIEADVGPEVATDLPQRFVEPTIESDATAELSGWPDSIADREPPDDVEVVEVEAAEFEGEMIEEDVEVEAAELVAEQAEEDVEFDAEVVAEEIAAQDVEADVDAVEFDVEAVEVDGHTAEAAAFETEVAEEVVEVERINDTEPATAPVEAVADRPTREVDVGEKSGPGWIKLLLPLLALALIAWLIISLLNSGPDEIVGNDLGGRSVSIGVEALPDGDTEGAGWDFDVWHEICDVIDCKADFVAAPWPGVLDQVSNGDIEAAINGISITEERKEFLDFSDPYLTIEQRMLVAGESSQYTSISDVIDDQAALIGTQAGTSDYELTQRLVTEDRIQTFSTLGAVMGALVSGDVDAVVFEDASGVGYEGEGADQLRAVEGTFGADELGFVFPRGSEYVGPVNHAIAELKADGRLDELARQYLAAP